jgi:peptidoglycan/xylan/chitin deacetylase (PgdA/CDA1 family)
MTNSDLVDHPEMTNSSLAHYPEILEEAADILESETVGWCKESYYQGEPSLPPVNACAIGAIRMAISRQSALSRWAVKDLEMLPYWAAVQEDAVCRKLRQYMVMSVPLDLGNDMSVPWNWSGIDELNDREETTKEQVIEVLKDAAKDWRNNCGDHKVL